MQSAIADEASTRESADNGLQSAIADEASMRESADNGLQMAIIALSQNDENNINEIMEGFSGRFADEASARKQADQNLDNTKQDKTATLADEDASDALPATISTAITTLLQTIRNNLKHLFNNKADKTNITAATKCKITYNAQGGVTGGTDLVAADIPNLSASKITEGTLAKARGGLGEDVSAGGTANQVFARPNGAAGAASFRALVAADIPSLAISKITDLQTSLNVKAPLASPVFTGEPKIPSKTTAATSDGTLIATEAQVALKANLASPSFTGAPKVGTNPLAVVSTASDVNEKSLPVGSIILVRMQTASPNRNEVINGTSSGIGSTAATYICFGAGAGTTEYWYTTGLPTGAVFGTWRSSGSIAFSPTNSTSSLYFTLCRRVA